LRVRRGRRASGASASRAAVTPALWSGDRASSPSIPLAESAALVGSIQIRHLARSRQPLQPPRPLRATWRRRCRARGEAVGRPLRAGLRRVPVVSFSSGVRLPVLAPEERLVEFVIPRPGPRSVGAICATRHGASSTIAWSVSPSHVTLNGRRVAKARIVAWPPSADARRPPRPSIALAGHH